ncbi:MAG: hypothetical protein MST05_07360 [Treponema sp.]|nr:hypothetical protein [Treponema sp.]
MMLPEKLTENTNGYFSLKTAAEFGITRWQLQELLRNGEIQKVSYGLYALKNVIPDELFITQLLSPRAIFSHESALFFNGYSDQVPFRYTISVPHGYISKNLSEQYDVRHVAKESAEEGIKIIKSELGNDLHVYSIERTLCELLHKPLDLDKERFIPAIQKYLRSKNKDILILMHFAKMFRVEKRLLPYLEAIQ